MSREPIAGGVLAALVFGATVAAVVVLLGTRDLETYEHAFVSLDRGTELQHIAVFGQPVYTPGLGLGVRLPLHGSLGASPAAAAAPFLPAPATYWLLLTLAIAPAVLIARHALEPLCGRTTSWLAMVLLFWSAPFVNYTVYDDWPETAVTYCASVACVFAAHALIAQPRLLGRAAVAGLTASMIVLAHPGYWPLLALALILSAALAVSRSEYPWRTRIVAVASLAAVSLLAVALSAPDILRELSVPGADAAVMTRLVTGPAGDVFAANLFPLTRPGPRLPFTYLFMAATALVAGLIAPAQRARPLAIGSAVVSIALGLGASMIPAGSSLYAPSAMWTLRDSAGIFAVFSGACAAACLMRRAAEPVPRAQRLLAGVLFLTWIQGAAYATTLALTDADEGGLRTLRWPRWTDNQVWMHDVTPPAERVARRGFPRELAPAPGRLALWPGARDQMRSRRRASTDFADAGYGLVSAWTKQRTMRGLVRPNEVLFNQAIDLPPEVLCDASAVAFLQLRYLLLPPDVDCAPWTRVPGVRVDDSLEVAIAHVRNDAAHALAAGTPDGVRFEPALSPGSPLLAALVPLPDTSVHVSTGRIDVRLDDAAVAQRPTLVLPVAYDTAWRASSGHVEQAGGLLAVAGVAGPGLVLEFVPDGVARLRALAMTAAQLLVVLSLAGLARMRPAAVTFRAAADGRRP